METGAASTTLVSSLDRRTVMKVYGVGVVEIENEEQLEELIKSDPAASINRHEYYPMRAVMPAK